MTDRARATGPAPQGAGFPAEPTVPTTTGAEWDTRVASALTAVEVPGMPISWADVVDELLGLRISAAIAKGVAVREHAQAWLAADGTAQQREQVAKLAASGAVLAADTARARVDVFTLLIDSRRLDTLGGGPGA